MRGAADILARELLLKTDLLKTDLLKTDLLKTDLLKTDLLKTDLLKTDLLKTDLLKTEGVTAASLQPCGPQLRVHALRLHLLVDVLWRERDEDAPGDRRRHETRVCDPGLSGVLDPAAGTDGVYDDRSFIVLTETKFSFRCIPVWDRYSPHRTRVEKKHM
jgi:hypothetical protein